MQTVQFLYMADQENRGRWNPIERRCLSLLRQTNSRASLLKIHAFMLRNALETNVCLLTKFIASCSSIATASDPDAGICYARSVFDRRPHRDDAFLCNCMIKDHVGIRQFPESITLYRDLRRDTGFAPNSFTFTSLTKSCGLDMATWEGQEIHDHVVKMGFCFDMFVSTALVGMYAKFGKMMYARDLFDEMTERSLVSWTALIVGYARSGDMGNAGMLFDQMPDKDTAVFNAMIDAYVKLGDMGSARNLFDEMSEQNVVSWTTMIHGYCENGDVDSARSLFDAMPKKNLLSWNAMISGYSQNKQPLEALRLFHEMQLNTPFEPDGVTIVSVLPAIAALGALDLGSWVHQFAQRKKLDRAANVCTALVDMCAKCGKIDEARSIFCKITKKEAGCWNAMINGFAMNGCGKEALETFFEMIRSGFKPNEITMISVLSACNHSGLVEEGKRQFKAIEEFGLVPQIEHYGCMIDLLGRAGLLDEAEKLIESMPYEANGIILSSFLFACQYSKDVRRAERVIKKAIEIEPCNNGNYVILRNLYALERRWRDVEEIKERMRMIGSKKEVGCSVIEIDDKVWEFVAGDSLHPQWEVIHLVIRQLWMHMKREGSD
ncbi:pentatricopeptide repeat-containing protein At2g44880-like [Malania oleifera]|uniref:pentatricopeptide repeat-containing protein At2g44880-like n=1 Tax=Malania oleifera TaxID=397392 RepID=UPI0025AEA73E|nr:pentatricopeptide repeat-containing protein At2g44880-like [Malania oleifera]